MALPTWNLLRDVALPFVDDADFITTQDLVGSATAQFGIPIRDNTTGSDVQGFMVLAQAIDATGAVVIPFVGTVAYTLLEVVKGVGPVHLIDTGLSGTLTVGAATAINLTTAAGFVGGGAFVLQLETAAGIPATGNLRVFFKLVTG